MTNPKDHLDAIADIRSMMERSSRFISLSGLSGISAGITALLGAVLAYLRLNGNYFLHESREITVSDQRILLTATQETIFDLVLIALGILIISLSLGIFFTTQNARKKKQPIWDKLTKRLLSNLFAPLAAGGIFCLALIYHGHVGMVSSATLVFYGLALINASKYTLHDIWYLGLTEIVLGLLSAFFLGYGLLFWSIGFGVMHIVYGTAMYVKYEQK